MRYIYRIQFPNNKCYIGQTKNIKQRMLNYKGLRCKKNKYYYLKHLININLNVVP